MKRTDQRKKQIGAALRRMRVASYGDTPQAEVARRWGISAQRLSNWENGLYLPPVDKFVEICADCKVLTIKPFLGAIQNL